MPRPKKPGAEPKKRSRNGCWPCKARKVKCGEEKPRCTNCERQGETCDYSIRLNWGGRTKRSPEKAGSGTSSATSSPHMSTFSFDDPVVDSPTFPPAIPDTPVSRTNIIQHARSRSANFAPTSDPSTIDPELMRISQPDTEPMLVVGGPFDQSQYLQQNMPRNNPPTSTPYDPRLHNPQYRGAMDYPSPSASSFDSLNYSNGGFASNGALESPMSPPSMLPPMRGMGSYHSPNNRHQRSQSAESPASSGLSVSESYSPHPGPLTPYSPYVAGPLTPNSSVESEDVVMRNAPPPASTAFPPPDLRRLSVQSLLTGPPGDSPHGCNYENEHGRQYPICDSTTITYGYDRGYPDLDTPKNDDPNAIAIFSPPIGSMGFEDEGSCGDTEVRGKDIAFEKGGYYAKPVAIKIPKSLGALPPLLLENPMNLLYFHHFLNHTARILVPHDCEQNPFRQVLPEMAVKDENIMNLLLAFSASHRARLLNQKEPANRIAVWVQDVFPKLRQSLMSSPDQISNSTLAPAIMLASLEIISPNTFEVPISWRDHLAVARRMIIARGGPRGVDRHDREVYFLSRWFAYLDVMGSLSGNKNDTPLDSGYWSPENSSADEDFQIDCLLGFTTRCVGILARIAELAKQCEYKRIDEFGNFREDWQPEEDVIMQAEQIRQELELGLSDRIVYKGCNHRSSDSSESEGAWDAIEIYATNEMFHWAGLIHLYRRVLGKSAMDPEVQRAVRGIVGLLYKVRRGSTAEACLLFPMFTAGCDARDEVQREKIMERLRCVEGFGMTQVHRARSLMQKVWDTGRPWESLVSGEFFG
ncbi:fungal-specific transcription factor domain-domain-containing protein [Clohesyomyces aquaticus]|uniref:Fungal-specific transcription factor domain-domain-containing protein n=1 Tax=Clohesyomyces aquaticus TaxID=1231657 RepID=A0A1Y1ZME5_9PLEO|nr:fungal-specific transcription factor domain-domain-containing protein [Clohesyomyces aquaticus]